MKMNLVIVFVASLILAIIIGLIMINSAGVEEMTASNCKIESFTEAYSVYYSSGSTQFQVDKIPYAVIDTGQGWFLPINMSACRVEESNEYYPKVMLAKNIEDGFSSELYAVYGTAIPSYSLWGGSQVICSVGNVIEGLVNSKPAEIAIENQKLTAATINEFTKLSVGWETKKLANGAINLIKRVKGSEEITVAIAVQCGLSKSELTDVYNQMNIGKVILEKAEQHSHYTGENQELKILSQSIESSLAKNTIAAQINGIIAGTINSEWKTETIRENNQKLLTAIVQAENKATKDDETFLENITKIKSSAKEKIDLAEAKKNNIYIGLDLVMPLRLFNYFSIKSQKNYLALFEQTLYPLAEKDAEKVIQEADEYQKISVPDVLSFVFVIALLSGVIYFKKKGIINTMF